MKNSKITFLILVILLLSISFIYRTGLNIISNESSKTENNDVKVALDEEPLVKIQQGSEESLIALSSDEVIRQFENSSSSALSLEVIETLMEQGKDALAHTLLKELHGRCQYKDSFSSPTGDDDSWFFNQIIKYCDDYEPYLAERMTKNNVEFQHLNPDVRKLIFSDETDIDIITESFLRELISMQYGSADFIADVSELIHFYNNEFNAPLNLG